jgi:hypothetical protein
MLKFVLEHTTASHPPLTDDKDNPFYLQGIEIAAQIAYAR